MIILKEVRLVPSVWNLDVYIIDKKADKSKLYVTLSERHGNSPKFYKNHTSVDAVHLLESTFESKLKESRIVLIYDGDIITLVHELVHVIWKFGDVTGAKISKSTQEWQALLYEYLYSEITRDSDWQIIE